MAKNAEHQVGDEVTVKGVVTRVGTNGGNPEYTVAVNDETSERPISVPQSVHPAAFTNGPLELAEANQKTYDEVKKDSEKAQAELDENAEDEAGSSSDQDQIRKETVTPDPKSTPAGNASAAVKPVPAKTVTK